VAWSLSANIRIVLVGTTHPGNIGGAARAMKNMGLNRLYLVAPKYFPSADATSRAAGADDILCRAVVCETLSEAIADCQIVIEASARSRRISWSVLIPRECAGIIQTEPESTAIAILFGREHSGLSNSELDYCDYWLKIPCNSQFASLNLAAAVQVVAYEILSTHQCDKNHQKETRCQLASSSQLESFYMHLYQVMSELGFIHEDKSKSIMRRLRRLFTRAQLEVKEVDILRGILSAAQGRKVAKKIETIDH